MIKYFDLQKTNRDLIKQNLTEFNILLKKKKNFILDELVNRFEKNFKKYIGSKYSIGVNSGTDALIIALKALDVKKGDEVILPSLTASATLASVISINAKPVFAEIDSNHLTINPEDIERRISKKTKLIIAVHLYGQACDMIKIRQIANKYNLFIIEDCAQSTGSRYHNKHLGNYGDIACHSFYPTKNLGGMGDGGMITTSNKRYYLKMLKLRQYGWDKNRDINKFGINSRLDEIQSFFLNKKLKFLDRNIKKKRNLAKIYLNLLKSNEIEHIYERKKSLHSYHIFAIKVKPSIRERLINYLYKRGIMTSVHYKIPCHKLKFFKNQKIELPITNQISKQIISLPLNEGLNEKDIKKICLFINIFLNDRKVN